MGMFSTDADILGYEPAIFGDLHFASQVLCKGDNGELDGVDFFAEGADFVSSGVQAGGVIYLCGGEGGLDGAYEIVSVESAEALTVSVLRGDDQQAPVSPGQGSGLFYRVSTFKPQAQEAFDSLTRYFGLRPGQPDGEYGAEDIVDSEVLRQVSLYMVLGMIYGSLNNSKDAYKARREYYERLALKERQRCRVAVSKDADSGRCVMLGGSIRLCRE
jgi:hypothetical protein